MTTAPDSLLEAREFIIDHVKINPAAVGIVGGPGHFGGYHCGRDRVVKGDYSVVESARDRRGLTSDASALDIGMFTVRGAGGKTYNLRDYSVWLVKQCRAGTADTADIREVIYSPDGDTVKRWDRLGVRSGGDSSHRTHTHKSYFRDTLHRDKTAVFRRWLSHIGALEGDLPGVEDIWSADLIPLWGKRKTKTNSAARTGWVLGSVGEWSETTLALARRILAEQIAARARQEAILKAVTGTTATADTIRAEFDKFRDQLAAQLAGELAEAVRDELADVPAETVDAAVTRALGRMRFTTDTDVA